MTGAKGEGPDAPHDRAPKTHKKNALGIIATPPEKASDISERLTLAGHGVHTGRDGGYLVHWQGLCCYCKDLAELQAHADKVLGGRP